MTDSQLNAAQRATPAGTPRARALGVPFGGTPGPWNAITDVPGVEVGYQTIIRGDTVRTGVTGIHPRGRGGAGDPVTAGVRVDRGHPGPHPVALDQGLVADLHPGHVGDRVPPARAAAAGRQAQ